MKKNSSVIKAGVFCTSLLVMICMNSSSAFGQDTSSINPGITYAGSNEKCVRFNIDFKSQYKEKIAFEVWDKEDNLLFSKEYDTSYFNKNVYLYKSDDYDWSDNDKVTFVIKSGKNEYRKTFGMYKKYSTVVDVVVAKL